MNKDIKGMEQSNFNLRAAYKYHYCDFINKHRHNTMKFGKSFNHSYIKTSSHGLKDKSTGSKIICSHDINNFNHNTGHKVA